MGEPSVEPDDDRTVDGGRTENDDPAERSVRGTRRWWSDRGPIRDWAGRGPIRRWAEALERDPAGELIGWALASFYVVLLVGLSLLALHVRGDLGELLAGLSPVVGIALYLLLWTTTWVTTRRAIADRLQSIDEGRPPVGRVAATGALWGGVNGAVFLLVLLGVAVGAQLLASLATGDWSDILFAVYLVAIGSVGAGVAFVVGAIVGTGLAILTIGLSRPASWLAATGGPRR